MASERFSCSAGLYVSNGNCIGVYDKSSKTVRLTLNFSSTQNLTTNSLLFTVPEAYRPKTSYQGVLLYKTSGNEVGIGVITVFAGGTITQNAGSIIRQGFAVIEYPIE